MSSNILGINERNFTYLGKYNRREAVMLADDKIMTKRLLSKGEVGTPPMYGIFERIKDFESFNWKKLPASFVIKPNRGFGGEGILILKNKLPKKKFLELPLKKRVWLKGDGTEVNFRDFKEHILNILDGNFSLFGLPDVAFIERRLIPIKEMDNYYYKGLPDIRVIVFNGVPVMAMMRLPTKSSKGKANMHQGAVGVGLDIATGMTTFASVKYPKSMLIEKHPDTGQEIQGFEVPNWNKILELAIGSQRQSGLGFMGADIAIDRLRGPEVLEINARPGLEIQVANLEGLAYRLDRVKGLKVKTIEKGIRIAKELFGGDLERKVEEVSGLEVIGVIEPVEIFRKSKRKKIKIKAKIDTGADSTSIDLDFARELGYKDLQKAIDEFELGKVLSEKEAIEKVKVLEKDVTKKYRDIKGLKWVSSSHGSTCRVVIEAEFILSGVRIRTLASVVSRKNLMYPMIVGKLDLKEFLIDPNK